MEVLFPGFCGGWKVSFFLAEELGTDGKTEVVSTHPAFLPSILPFGQSINLFALLVNMPILPTSRFISFRESFNIWR